MSHCLALWLALTCRSSARSIAPRTSTARAVAGDHVETTLSESCAGVLAYLTRRRPRDHLAPVAVPAAEMFDQLEAVVDRKR